MMSPFIIILIIFVITSLYPLINFSLVTHGKALQKGAFIFFVSMLPVIGGFLFCNGGLVIKDEELFIYAAAYLGPVLYWFYEIKEEQEDSYNKSKEIKGTWFIMMYSVIIIALTAVLYGVSKSHEQIEAAKVLSDTTVLSSPVKHGSDTQFPSLSSCLILLCTLILWYFTLAYEKGGNDSSKLRKQEKDFNSEVAKKKGEKK